MYGNKAYNSRKDEATILVETGVRVVPNSWEEVEGLWQ